MKLTKLKQNKCWNCNATALAVIENYNNLMEDLTVCLDCEMIQN